MTKYEKFSEDEIKKYIHGWLKLHIKGKPVEKFKQLKLETGYTGYLVSSYGRIASTNYRGNTGKVKILKPNKHKCGYMKIVLFIDGKKRTYLVHRLVALTFISNEDNKPQVNHKDGIKYHNFIWNLEWMTSKENHIHVAKNNLKHPKQGEDVVNSKHTNEQVHHVCRLLEENILTLYEISEVTNVSYYMVLNISSGKSWKSITKDYDLTLYTGGKSEEEIIEHEKKIHSVCKMLESNNHTIKEISESTGISYGMVIKILKKECHVKISEQYEVDNYKAKNKKND